MPILIISSAVPGGVGFSRLNAPSTIKAPLPMIAALRKLVVSAGSMMVQGG